MNAIEPAPRSRSGRTNCRKDQQPYRLQAAKNQASWYCSSWRGLQSDASTPDDSRLITPETTPPSIPTNLATAPNAWRTYSDAGATADKLLNRLVERSGAIQPKADSNGFDRSFQIRIAI